MPALEFLLTGFELVVVTKGTVLDPFSQSRYRRLAGIGFSGVTTPAFVVGQVEPARAVKGDVELPVGKVVVPADKIQRVLHIGAYGE